MYQTLKDLEKIINSSLTTKAKNTKIEFDALRLETDIEDLFETILFLKSNEKCRFKQLIDIAGVDFPEKEKRFKIIYFFLSHENNLRISVHTSLKESSKPPSITKIFPSANWMEREVFDMYGIKFTEHPDLRRILTDYVFEGYPLRKDFPLTGNVEVRYDEDKKKVVYEPVKLEQDYRDFDFSSPWEGTKYIKEELDKEKK